MPADIDIDLGAPGDPHEPVRQALERRGIRISNETIRRLRLGTTGPTRTAYRLACVDKLRANDAALKTEYCVHALEVGREQRQPSREPPRVYACFGLTRAMQAALGCTTLELSYVLRVMRADLALWSTCVWDDRLVAEFSEAASLFLRIHGHRSWRVLHGQNDVVNAAWDKHTIHGFYFALYGIAGSLTRAAWVPYELDLLRSFYVRQRELGDPLTPLDRQVLAGSVNLSPTTSELSRMVRAHVGVQYDQGCVSTHRHLLVSGFPKAVSASEARYPSAETVPSARCCSQRTVSIADSGGVK